MVVPKQKKKTGLQLILVEQVQGLDGIDNMRLERERVGGKKEEIEYKSQAHRAMDEKVNETVLRDISVMYVEPFIFLLVVIGCSGVLDRDS